MSRVPGGTPGMANGAQQPVGIAASVGEEQAITGVHPVDDLHEPVEVGGAMDMGRDVVGSRPGPAVRCRGLVHRHSPMPSSSRTREKAGGFPFRFACPALIAEPAERRAGNSACRDGNRSIE